MDEQYKAVGSTVWWQDESSKWNIMNISEYLCEYLDMHIFCLVQETRSFFSAIIEASILSFMWNLHKCMGTNRTLGEHACVTLIKFKQQEGIHKPTSLISACPTEMIKHEIWGRHITQQYEGQEKVEQEIVTKRINKKIRYKETLGSSVIQGKEVRLINKEGLTFKRCVTLQCKHHLQQWHVWNFSYLKTEVWLKRRHSLVSASFWKETDRTNRERVLWKGNKKSWNDF